MNGEALSLPNWAQGMTKLTDAQATILQDPVTSLAKLQVAACAAIDEQAGPARAKYITDTTGQAGSYLR
jgi:hypothetical protein